ncbi:MAG: LamG-like jellyroll fold domain-containing protein, partial [Candidatus Limnocylindrales bacterium]
MLTRGATNSQLYLDGSAVGSSWATAPSSPGANFSIGVNSSGQHLAGTIDDVATYGTALSSATISSHFGAGRASGVAANIVSRMAFDPLGRPVDAWGPNNPSSTNPSPNLARTHDAYDRLGHLVSVTLDDIAGGTTTAGGDTNVASTYAYDALGELTGYCP